MSLNTTWEKIKDFHEQFNYPIGMKPHLLPSKRAAIRANWMKEEIEEFSVSKTIEDQADALIDLIYFAIGTLVEMGVKPQEIFDIVHESNMQKIPPTIQGKIKISKKAIKPKNWDRPQIKIKEVIEEMEESIKTG